MAVLAYVSGSVRTAAATSSQLTTGVLGETVEAGQPLYQSSADNKYYECDGDTVDPANASFDGFALNGGDEDDTISIQTGGSIYLGVSATQGMFYCVSATKGNIEDAVAALTTGLNSVIVGYGDASGNIVIDVTESGLNVYP